MKMTLHWAKEADIHHAQSPFSHTRHYRIPYQPVGFQFENSEIHLSIEKTYFGLWFNCELK